MARGKTCFSFQYLGWKSANGPFFSWDHNSVPDCLSWTALLGFSLLVGRGSGFALLRGCDTRLLAWFPSKFWTVIQLTPKFRGASQFHFDGCL